MRVCVCVCIHTHIYIHTYIHTYIHINISTSIKVLLLETAAFSSMVGKIAAEPMRARTRS